MSQCSRDCDGPGSRSRRLGASATISKRYAPSTKPRPLSIWCSHRRCFAALTARRDKAFGTFMYEVGRRAGLLWGFGLGRLDALGFFDLPDLRFKPDFFAFEGFLDFFCHHQDGMKIASGPCSSWACVCVCSTSTCRRSSSWCATAT